MNKDQISKMQQAVWKLQEAQRLLMEASDGIDPIVVIINNAVRQLEFRLEQEQ